MRMFLLSQSLNVKLLGFHPLAWKRVISASHGKWYIFLEILFEGVKYPFR